MSTIKVSDLAPAGADLFSDSESYMREMSDAELALQGGSVGVATAIAFTVAAVCVGIAELFEYVMEDDPEPEDHYNYETQMCEE